MRAAGAQQAEWLRTGGMYQLVHAVAAIAIMGVARGPAMLLLAGASDLCGDAVHHGASAGRAGWARLRRLAARC